MLEECRRLGGCKTGQAKATKAYNLPAKFVIHTVGPIWGEENGREDELLALCYRNSLQVGVELKIRSIAFPAISAGIYGFPKREAAEIAVREAREFPDSIDSVIFVCFDDETAAIYSNLLKA